MIYTIREERRKNELSEPVKEDHASMESATNEKITPPTGHEKRQKKRLHISATMRDMLLALVPILVFSVSYFGYRVLIITVISVLSASFAEIIYVKLFKRSKNYIFDFSSAVTGFLLAFLLPPEVTWYFPVIGSFFAVFFVKMVFGGYGQNLVNPALAGRLLLLLLFPKASTDLLLNGVIVDTPLTMWVSGKMDLIPSYASCLLGVVPGFIGETSVILLVISGIFLIWRKMLDPRISLPFFLGFALVTLLYGKAGFYPLITSDTVLVGLFMATDPVTAPKNKTMKWIYGGLTGLLMAVVRILTPLTFYASSVVLLMNLIFHFLPGSAVSKRQKSLIKE